MNKKDDIIHGFKGFNKDLKCRGFQYEIGKDYEQEGEVKCCERGFHFCENPFDVFRYYSPSDSRYCEVEGDGNADKSNDDSKVATSHIHISAEIGLNGLIKAGVKFILDKVNFKDAKSTNTGDYSAATNTGDQSAATNTGFQSAATNTGDRSAATNTGDQSAATNTGFQSAATNTGDQSAATNTGFQSAATNTGDRSAATNTGYCSAAINTGDRSAATNTGDQSAATNTGFQSAATNTGDYSAATNTGFQSAATNTGDRSAATNTGDRSAATNTGDYSAATVEGKESVAIVTGKDGRARGVLGSWIVLTERGDLDGNIYHINEVKAFKVDGVNIKENVFIVSLTGSQLRLSNNNFADITLTINNKEYDKRRIEKVMPILTAFVEGKTIQCYDHNAGKWKDEVEQLHTADLFVWPSDFRIKPEPTYHPFKDGVECWEEMQKHKPFGWVKYQCDFFQIIHVDYNSIGYGSACGTILHSKFEDIFKDSTFADGTPFGMKEE